MAVSIIWDEGDQIAALYCTTSDTAFGPIFTGPTGDVDAEQFLEWLRENPPHWAVGVPIVGDGCDARDYPADELERIVNHWRQLVEDGEA